MADQTFAVHCGFFDAINSDRTYSADEMNRPYKRVISNGVFATPNGTPSTDLQVTASSGMNIICKKGEGLFGDKWFENPSGIAITVPSNTGTVPRIDSVLVQVDTRTSGRVGNIVHRTGTPASSPVPPTINQTEGVVEYRLANIRVNAGVSAITQSMITDRRGSSDCPWVTSLIYQVDTSTLYDQWQAAYAEYFEEEKAIWDAWYAQLTEDLDVSMTLDRQTNTVTTTAQTTGTIPIGLAYNHNTDILEVYINGLRAIEGTHYVVVNNDTSIQVENQLDIGQAVTFVVMRSVISGSATNITVLLQELESQIAGIAGGTPTVVDSTSDMTDTEKIYVLSSDSKWYYYSATQEDWVIGGTYGGVPTDTTLTQQGMAADAKVVGDALALKADNTDVTALDTRVTAVEGLDETVNGITVLNYTEGKNITSAGVITDDDNSSLSELIPLTWTWDSETKNRFYFNKAEDQPNSYYIIVFYDENQNYLGYKGSFGDTERPVVGFDGSAYVRFSFRKGTVGKLTNNGITTTYWIASEILTQKGLVQNVGNLTELDTTNKDSLVEAINEVKGDIPESPLPISPKDTDFFYISKNLINPSECVEGEYVNQATGAFGSLSRHNRTDYVEINPSTTYVVRQRAGALGSNFRYVFYTSAKAYISGAVGSLPDMLLTSPANAKYIVISDTYAPSDMMIAPYVDEDKSYEAYDVYLLPEYIKQDMSDVLLNVPSKVYALVGFETNIYFENITEDWTKYEWDVTCAVGRQMERGYQITPTASDVGTKTLTIRATDEYGNVNTVSTSLVITAANAGSGQTKTVIVLGDSTTNNGKVIEKLNEDFASDVMSVTTLGTRGTAPNNHEGRSGWSWDTYFTQESVTYTDGRGTVYNPFYNPSTQTFDASYYFANSGISKPDFFIVNMGINDVFGFTSDSAYESGVMTILERAETAVQSVLDATTTTKVCVCLTIPPNHSQDAFGKAYNCGQTRNRYKRNNTLWVDALMNLFKDRESERIYLIPINACLDTIYNMGMETLPVNARNTDITYQSPIGNGGVHPVESGYWQIADVYTAFIKANL